MRKIALVNQPVYELLEKLTIKIYPDEYGRFFLRDGAADSGLNRLLKVFSETTETLGLGF